MDGIPAHTLWDLVIEVFHSEPNRTNGPKREPWRNPSAVVKPNMDNSIPIKHTNVIPTNIDHIPSNTTHSGSSAMLYVFEDNEAAMRHVSRTHRVALDWLCDRTYFGPPKFKSVTLTPKHQVADMLTKGNFTLDEWNSLLHLFNGSHFSSTCCTENFSLIRCSTVAKRIQDRKEEKRVVSKSRPAVMTTSSHFNATSSSAASSPIASKSPGMPIASGKPDSRMSSKSFDAASTSQVRLNDAYTYALMHADSCSDVGHFWDLDQGRNGTELFLINLVETGTRLLKA